MLDRHESLAANLGAKLTGPRLLKGIEKFFDGPIKTNAPPHPFSPISWIDVVNFAKATPNDFILVTLPDGQRCCQFICKGLQVEITEDDWRLISSGALDRFPTEHPFEEDEVAELATLDILEQRASMLYKKADEVAARARILHHRLGQRKQELARRRNPQAHGGDQRRSQTFAPPYDLHADLLQQFLASAASRSSSGAGLSTPNLLPISPTGNSPHHQHRLSVQSGRSSTSYPSEPPIPAPIDHRAELIRSLVTQKVEKQAKGELINPPCDRCRRLKLQCTRNLTACQGCTKKHAKCSWKSVTDEEASALKREVGLKAESDAEKDKSKELAEGGHGRGGEGPPRLATAEEVSRPESRAETDTSRSIPYSPDVLSSARSDHSMDSNRGLMSGNIPSLMNAPPPLRRDGPRLSQITSMAPTHDYFKQGPGAPSPGGYPGPPRQAISPFSNSSHYGSPHGQSPHGGTPQHGLPHGDPMLHIGQSLHGTGLRGQPPGPHGGYGGQGGHQGGPTHPSSR